MKSTPGASELSRREIYRRILGLLPAAGGGANLLNEAAEEMRRLRGLKAASKANGRFAGLESLLARDDALGLIYQAINSPALESAYRATAQTGRKFAESEIPAVTQLFTPRWVVEFLLHNTVGRLWKQMHPDSRLNWKWMTKGDESPRGARNVKELRICDPACGTMNFGLVALEMLREMYREEGYDDQREIDLSIIQNNLVGFDIDPTAIELGVKSLEIKTGLEIREHRLRVADALFDEKLDSGFDVVATNPPYLSSRNLQPGRIVRLKKKYPAGWRDAYACFILKSLDLLAPGGRAGILSMHSFMFTGAFEKLRREILRNAVVESAAHFGPGLFDIGNPGTLQTVAMVLHQSAEEGRGVFFRLVDEGDKEKSLREAVAGGGGFEVSSSELSQSPRAAWMYWANGAVRRAFKNFKPLGEIAPPRQGLATTDNLRFVRYWWEVEPPGFRGARSRWIPYAKGGRFCRWYETARHRVDWEEDGRRIKQAIVTRYPYLNGEWSWVAKNSAWYGRAGITYSYLTSGKFSARVLEEGTFFDVAGSALFPEDRLGVLGVLNSSAARILLAAINPTVNFQVGDLRLLPMPEGATDELRREVAEAVELSRRRDRGDETSAEFTLPLLEGEAREIASKLRSIERRIDQAVCEMYGIERELSADDGGAIDGEELEKRLISFAVGRYLGRWGDGGRRRWVCLSPLDRDLEDFIRGSIGELEIDLERFLSREFSGWHNRLYHGRPVIWVMAGCGKIVATDGSDTGEEILGEMLKAIGGNLPRGWRRRRDEPIHLNLAPLAEWIADAKLRASLLAARHREDVRREPSCESVALL
jgi:hypothetical protein